MVIYDLGPIHFLSAPGLAWQNMFKKIDVELELLADVDMLLIKEKGIRGRYVMQYIYKQQQIKNTRKTKTKTKNHHILCIYIHVIYIDGQCLKNYL